MPPPEICSLADIFDDIVSIHNPSIIFTEGTLTEKYKFEVTSIKSSEATQSEIWKTFTKSSLDVGMTIIYKDATQEEFETFNRGFPIVKFTAINNTPIRAGLSNEYVNTEHLLQGVTIYIRTMMDLADT
eukprot:TRINITY_DN8599_c0_g1_i1.p1 TRINITY_DN8599_c0_g1~~TRINITY_DN8599_c0_g1_i1.p1  ORF type:complete len:146 (+),score=32.58 TRINITY_DN8599_c0_g1_i1:53-439(+)